MIRVELFGDAWPRPFLEWRLGLEIQIWKWNLQVNIGFSLFHMWNLECKKFRKSGRDVYRYFLFTGLGPVGVAAWMDP